MIKKKVVSFIHSSRVTIEGRINRNHFVANSVKATLTLYRFSDSEGKLFIPRL